MSSTSAQDVGLAEDIAHLRAVLQAAAQRFNVDIPTSNGERVPEPKFDPKLVQPKDEGYDETITIQQRTAFVPDEHTLDLMLLELQTYSGVRVPLPKMKIWPQHQSLSGTGLQPLVDWSLDGPISKNVREYGYTAEGYLCALDSGSGEGPAQNGDSPRPGNSFSDHIVSTYRS